MAYDKNYTGTTGSTGTPGSTGSTSSPGSTGYSRTGSYSSPGYGGSSFGSQGYNSPGYSPGYGSSFENLGQMGGGSSRTLLMLFVGAAVGAAVALLTAPTTGREARQNLQRWARDTKDKATQMAGNMTDKFGRATDEFGGGVASTVGHGNEDREIPQL